MNDRIMVSQRGTHPDPPILRLCFITWQRGTEVADGIKIANYLTKFKIGRLSWIIQMGLM